MILAAASTASAQAKAPLGDAPAQSAEADAANASHRAGVVAFAKGHYREAIALFLKADRLRPSAAFSFNIARCYEQLNAPSRALAAYRDYLRRAPGASDAQTVKRQIARLEKRFSQQGVQQVSISSTPSGAAVMVDGSSVGLSPWIGELAPGSHTVQLAHAGYHLASKQFELKPEHALDVQLAMAALEVPAAAPPPAPSTAPWQPSAGPQITLDREPSREPDTAPAQHAPERALAVQEHGSPARLLGWIALGAGGLALGGALTFEVLRHDAQKDAQREPTQIKFAEDLETMRERQTLARVLVGVGAGLAVTGGVLLAVGSNASERASGPRVGLSCAPSKCKVSLASRF
jgi:tetratricopeptide (TPR) repeat protein